MRVADDLVELLDAGAEPRRPLRWRAEEGTRGAFTLDWTLEGTTTSTLDGKPVSRALHARFVVDAAVRTPARVDLRVRSVDSDAPDLERIEASHVLLEPGERRIAIAAPHHKPFVATIEKEVPRKYPAERAVLLQAVDEVLGAGVTGDRRGHHVRAGLPRR